MRAFLVWLDDVLFSPPHRFEDVARAVLLLLEREAAEDAPEAATPAAEPALDAPKSREP